MLSKFSVKKPYTIIVGIVLATILSIISFTNLTSDLLPEMELPYVVVYTIYPGASSEKVEKSVTNILEPVLATTSNLENINSVSSNNTSMIMLEFSEDTNMDSATIDINAKIDLVKGQLDDMVSAPVIMNINPNMMPIMSLSISHSEYDLVQLSSFLDEKILSEIQKVEGVASVNTNGNVKDQIVIQLNDDAIEEINQKLLDNINKPLADARRLIYNSNKDLNQKKNETALQLSNATTQLNSANNKLDVLLSQQMINQNKITSLNAELNGYQNAIKQLQQSINIQNSYIIKIESLNSNSLIQTILPDPVLETYLKTLKLENTNTLGQLNQSLKQNVILNQTLLKSSQDQHALRQPQIENEINNLNNYLMTSNLTKDELTKQSNQLKQQISTLESTKLLTISELTKVEIQLNESLKQMDDAIKNANKSLDLTSSINPDLISTMLTAQNFSMPAGYLPVDDNHKLLIKVGDEFTNTDEIKNLVLFSFDFDNLKEIKLSDIANVSLSNNSSETYAKINGNDGIILTLQKQSNASTNEVCKDVNQKLQELEENFPNTKFTVFMDQGVYIDLVIDSVLSNLAVGGVLAILILFFFLKDIKPTLIIGISIPISLMLAIILMYFSGVNLNLISLSGLALGVGMLVDNSIVILENIFRLKNENIPIKEACVQGAKEMTGAIAASTLTTICVFLPIVFTKGIARQLFTDMGLTIAYSLLASLIIAISVVPMLSSKILGNVQSKENKTFNKLLYRYDQGLTLCLKHKTLTIIIVLSLLVISIGSVFIMGTSFMPDAQSYQMSATVSLKDPKDNTTNIKQETNKLVESIQKINDITDIGAISGGGLMMNSSNNISLYLILSPDKKLTNEEIAQQIKDLSSNLPTNVDVQTSNMSLGMLSGSGIQLVLKGNNYDQLYEQANTIKTQLDLKEINSITIGDDKQAQEIRIQVDKKQAIKYGLTVAQVFQQVTQLTTTKKDGPNLVLEDGDFKVVILKDEKHDKTVDQLKDLTLSGTLNQQPTLVKLSDVAKINIGQSLTSINHDNQQRTLTINLDIDKAYNIGIVSKEVESIVHEIDFPKTITYEFKGENTTIVETMTQLVLMILLAVAFIYLIMVAQFQSLLYPFIVMFTIPLAFTGGLLGLLITNNELSVISLLGFLVLFGIVVNNGIVFIDSINQLKEKGVPTIEAIHTAGQQRLRPILMTALTTILALSTMALGLGQGAEMLAPMSIVTIGGLSYATILTMFVVPVLYTLFDKKEK
ncbi:MAG: efflux RND transporter permease subunit [Erysipelotrichaceae bacterium]